MRIVFVMLLTMNIVGIACGQVNLQTGSASYGIPVFNWKDEKSRLNSSISLNYNSGNGLKIDEAASNIGQGWNLMSGGVITRLQVGEPDDQHAIDFVDQSSQKAIQYPDGYLYNPVSASSGCPQIKSYYPIYKDKNTVYKENNIASADREQDYFSFEFNGRSNLFVLDKSNMHFAKVLGDSKLIISYEESNMTGQNIRTTISSFTIEDENGLIYRFKDKALTRVLRNHYAQGDFVNNAYGQIAGIPSITDGGIYHQGTFDELLPVENPYVVSNWYLSEVEDRFNHRKITYSYSTENINTYAGQTINLIITNPVAFLVYGQKNFINVLHHRTIAQNLVVNQINFPDGHQANFGYSNIERTDAAGSHALQYISISYLGSSVTRLELQQDYYGNHIANKVQRLYLIGYKQYSSDLQDYRKYVFEYFMSSGTGNADDFIPPVYFECKDSYGYYNGDASGIQTNGILNTFQDYSKLCWFKKDVNVSDYKPPKAGYAKIGLLKRVTMPAGGSLEFGYDQIPNYGGVVVSSTINKENPSASKPQITTYNYVLANGQSSMWGNEPPENKIIASSYYGPEEKGFNGVACNYHYQYPGILSMDEAVNTSSLHDFFNVFSLITGYASLAYDVFSVVYAAIAGVDLECAIILFVFDILNNVVTTCLDDASETDTYKIYYSVNFKMSNPLPLQFKRVEVQQISDAINNGKTIQEFTSPDDYPGGLLVPSLLFPYSYKPRAIAWAYGLPKITTTINSSGIPVSQNENKYSFLKAKNILPQSAFESCKCGVKLSHSKNNLDWATTGFGNQYQTSSDQNMEVDQYSLYSGRVELSESDERMYKDASTYSEIKTLYDYNDKNYQISKMTSIESNNDKIIKEIYYPVDFTTPGILQTLTANNVIGTPVSTYESIQKNNSSLQTYLAAAVTDFTLISNGDIKPYADIVGRSQAPVSFTFDAGNPQNYPGLVTSSFSTYDQTTGNLSGVTDEGGHSSSYLYDYNDKKIVATILNANAVEDKFAYSSFETSQMGGWVLNTDPIYVLQSAVTGMRSLSLSASNTLSSVVSTSATYTVSFWADNPLSINTGTLVKSGPLLNGFTYYEYLIPAGTSQVQIQGTGKIDELRLYPSFSRMNTMAYDPVLLLKITESDQNNRIANYEYDSWGRLLFVRDEQKNIIKMYEYNLKK